MYTEEQNQMISTYISIQFLYELHMQNFVKSDTYNQLNFQDEFVKEHIKSMGIMNHGMLPALLYMILVTPKEILFDKYQDDYQMINQEINSFEFIQKNTTYRSDRNGIDYSRHIRNSIAHMNITYADTGITFQDYNKRLSEEFIVSITWKDFGLMLEKFKNIYVKYIEEVKENIISS